MDRRDFARLSALALASAALPNDGTAQYTTPPAGRPGYEPNRAGKYDPNKPIGYALIGLGSISEMFARACQAGHGIKVTALVTGHADTKGKEWAAKYGVPESSIYSYETFDKIIDNKSVDAVYIGLPNSLHCEFTKRAAQAGKHVLCEKPMAISSAECRDMIVTCAKSRVKLMIAYRCHYDPAYLEADRLVQSGAIGKIQSFEGAFGFNIKEPGTWRLDPKLAGGGPLLDVGIYPLNAMRYFSHQDPYTCTAFTATRDTESGRFVGMEESMTFGLKFQSGILGTASTSYGANMPGYLRIHGETGTLELSPAYDYKGLTLKSLGNPDLNVNFTSPGTDTTQFQMEAEHFAQCIRNNVQPRTPGEEGLKDMSIIEAIYNAAGKHAAV